METTTPKPTGTDNTIRVINAIFGTAHLFFQTAADLTAEAEGRLVEKVSKGAITRQQSITHRKQSTELKQAKALAKIREIQSRSKQQPQPITDEPQN